MTETKAKLLVPVDIPASREAADRLAAQVKAHPALVVAGGLALGVIASALLPRGTARMLAKGAAAAAAIGGEAGLGLARQARERAQTAAGDAADAAGSAGSTGRDLARAAIRWVMSLKR